MPHENSNNSPPRHCCQAYVAGPCLFPQMFATRKQQQLTSSSLLTRLRGRPLPLPPNVCHTKTATTHLLVIAATLTWLAPASSSTMIAKQKQQQLTSSSLLPRLRGRPLPLPPAANPLPPACTANIHSINKQHV
jgi:hypothetical protein